MRFMRNHLIGVDQGSLVLFSDFETGGPMWTGTGPRAVETRVRFSETFRAIPSVHVSLAMFDFGRGANQRADVSAEAVDVAGFTLVFRTWSDTRVARVRASWMAIGEAAHNDDWEGLYDDASGNGAED
ncbi:H-type lectin domain-containing protein [Tropicimonas sp. IMCC34011]|uniref:H-type lectin domain-containing protein n=1 Tax=Tropicimonas sp. IMCC34011 TaxID=2248759 RepID=UPI000E267532|nr:H-type lectin domain-containing protein [Tropicimonas sp. IMCC34011]